MRLTLLIIVCAIASAIFLAIPYVSLSQTTLKQNQMILQQAPAQKQATVSDSQIGHICTRRAKGAVSQNKLNQQMGCGFKGSQWHGDFQAHYQRCQKIGAREEMKNYKLRLKDLNACRAKKEAKQESPTLGKSTQGLSRGEYKAAYCGDYANKAISQHKKNKQMGCGLGPIWEWHASWKTHYGWCMKKDLKTSRTHSAKRSQSLKACRAKAAAKGKHTAYCRGGGKMELEINIREWGGFTGYERYNHIYFTRSKAKQVQQLKPGECMLAGSGFFVDAHNFLVYESPSRQMSTFAMTIGNNGVKSYEAHSSFVYRIVRAMRTKDIFSFTVKYHPKEREYHIVDLPKAK